MQYKISKDDFKKLYNNIHNIDKQKYKIFMKNILLNNIDDDLISSLIEKHGSASIIGLIKEILKLKSKFKIINNKEQLVIISDGDIKNDDDGNIKNDEYGDFNEVECNNNENNDDEDDEDEDIINIDDENDDKNIINNDDEDIINNDDEDNDDDDDIINMDDNDIINMDDDNILSDGTELKINKPLINLNDILRGESDINTLKPNILFTDTNANTDTDTDNNPNNFIDTLKKILFDNKNAINEYNNDNSVMSQNDNPIIVNNNNGFDISPNDTREDIVNSLKTIIGYLKHLTDVLENKEMHLLKREMQLIN